MKSINKGLLLPLFFYWTWAPGIQGIPNFNITQGRLNETINGLSTFHSSQVYYYEISKDMVINPKNARFKIITRVNNLASRECPVLFTVQGHRTVVSWELPVFSSTEDGMQIYSTMARTLCLHSDASVEQTISVMVTSCSAMPISFAVLLILSEDLVVGIGETKVATITPTMPEFYNFHFSTDMKNNLLVQVESPDETCMTISIQDLECPVMDQESNIAFQGDWQTISSKAGLTVRKKRYSKGFTLVFLVLFENKRCLEYFGLMPNPDSNLRSLAYNEWGPRAKNISFVIEEEIDTTQYVIPTILPLVLTFLLIFIVFVIFSVFQNLKVKTANKIHPNENNNIELDMKSGRSCLIACQTPIKIQDLKKANPKKLINKSQRYFWILLIITVFYCVPVFQLITNYLKVVYRTGEQDICYYNFYCARPLGYVMDFNHIYSNISYILFGIAFIILVRLRRNSFVIPKDENSQQVAESESDQGMFRKVFPILDSTYDHGVLQHFGLFYAIGIALISEGLLSGAYHICPNQSNFQFDTSFMYIIAVLGLVKVYQFRHPVHISVNVTFIILAFVASSAVLGLLFNAIAFKICFSVLYLFTIFILLIYLYFIGYVEEEDGQIVTSWFDIFDAALCITLRSIWSPDYEFYKYQSHKSQLILPIVILFFNVSFIILQWTMLYNSNFATQLLGIFVMNFFVYTAYYCNMKLIHGEYKGLLWLQPLIYAIAAVIFWGFALYYFINAMSSWSESPAQSRTYNDFCIVADFYDNHDLWHFLSAGGLFCSFMMLLTIDDDLLQVKQTKIPVF